MARPRETALLLLAAACFAVISSLGSAGNSLGLRHAEELVWARNSACAGTVGECGGAGEEEYGLSSEFGSRRSLATSNYIGYNALSSDSVPCSQRGASYYNCQPGAQANPYSRGCSAITQCRTS
uniref:Rapid alkalinization factor-like n=1 Tax=Ananas comosus var. bracteatus TaxID=296719 RepID=A0A6V7PC84_ANACO|nr:unnamed protein product [Ananas comosus var. bracteatus]